MTLKIKTIIFSTLISLSTFSLAQQTNQTGADNTPPKSNLGNAVPQIVYPTAREINEGLVQDLEAIELTPEQWERLKALQIYRDQQRAQPYPTPPKPVTRSLFVNLDAGMSPPAIRLARGQISSIVFADTQGNEWIIERVMLNRSLFSDGTNSESSNAQAPMATNVLSIEPLQTAAYGNVTVTLRGLPTPVIFILVSGQNEVDLRVDAKIPGINPDMKSHQIASYRNAPEVSNELAYFMDNVPPKDASRLRVSGIANTYAWEYKGNLYLRTRADVQYPAFISAARSTTGMSVFKFARMHNNITLTSGGQAITIQIKK